MWIVQLLACTCGGLDISGTTMLDAHGEGYNGHWTEQCGVNTGASGNWNLFGDGGAYVTFFWGSTGDRDWQAIDIEMEVAMPLDRVRAGETIEAADLAGSAQLNPCIDCGGDRAGVTEGRIEVIDGDDDVDPCAGDGPAWRIDWDLTFGAVGGPLYETRGRDRVRFSNFLSASCGG